MRKLISLVVIGFLILANYNLLKSSYESHIKLSQISQEEEKVKDLEEVNLSLREELKKRDSTSFIEQEARNRLGLGKPGESAILVEGNPINQSNSPQTVEKPNFQKWVDLLKI
jgi:cell division protein DivIC